MTTYIYIYISLIRYIYIYIYIYIDKLICSVRRPLQELMHSQNETKTQFVFVSKAPKMASSQVSPSSDAKSERRFKQTIQL